MTRKVADLAVIIPSHEKTDTLLKAIDSVFAQTTHPSIVLVATKDVLSTIDDDRAQRMTLVEAGEDTSYPALVNQGIEAAKELEGVNWFTILEHDDELLPKAVENFVAYSSHDPETPVWSGLGLHVNRGNGDGPPELKSMLNDAAWAPNIMETPGTTDFNAMLRMNFVFLNGCFFKFEVVDEVGLLKPNMKMFADYEFLLRVVYNGHDIRSIPKATHYHYAGGKMTQDLNGTKREETEFWVTAARKEYFYEFDREIAYEPAEETETAEA